jgi:NAD(P)-dependent dehydrogenase (short-subunit alcohol dehydrogenase family)
METTARPVAVVTGAAQGIGRKVAEALAGEGYALALSDLRAPAETLEAVRGRCAEALTVVGDVTSQADVAALAEQVRRQLGGASVLVNNAGKHGLLGLTRTLAAEWGGRGVRVNAVCPGWVKTEMDITAQASGAYRDDDIVGQVPMGRFATPDDVAAVVAFLADPTRSGFINGVALPVDGGWTADASWTALRLGKRRT